MTYEVYATENFLKELSKQPKSMQDRITNVIWKLKFNPHMGDYWKRDVFTIKYKVEIENLKIIYDVNNRNKSIVLFYLHKKYSQELYRKIRNRYIMMIFSQYLLLLPTFFISNFFVSGSLILFAIFLGVVTMVISYFWFEKGMISPNLYDFSIFNALVILPMFIVIWLSLTIKVASC